MIFQKNVAADVNEIAVAWRVIHNAGLGDSHSFLLPDHVTVDAHDSFGNFAAPVVAHSWGPLQRRIRQRGVAAPARIEGEIMSSAILQTIHTQLALTGITPRRPSS